MRGWQAYPLLTLVLAGCVVPAADFADHGAHGVDVFPGDYDTTGLFSRVLQPGPFTPKPDEVVVLPSDLDGAAIQMAISRPAARAEDKVPIVLWISPYLSDLATTPIAEQNGMGGQEGDNGVYGAFLVENFVTHGYAVAAIAVRGTAGSGGCFEANGPKERADVLQAVDWLAKQPWTTGDMGGFGLSYEGFALWGLASTGHPALKTIVTFSTTADAWDFGARNGTTSLRWLAVQPFISTYAQTARDPRQLPGHACPETAVIMAEAARATLLPDSEARESDFIAQRSFREAIIENYRGSAFVAHGFRDSVVPMRAQYPWALALEGTGVPAKHLLGQWGHSTPDNHGTTFPNPTVRWDTAELVLRWFDRWVKGNETVDTGPYLQVADSAGNWRREDAWPPPDAEWKELHLASDRSLTMDAAGPAGSVLLHTLGEGAAFATPPLERDMRFAGRPQAHVQVTPSGPGGRLFVELHLEDGKDRTLLTDGGMDLAYASSDDPRPVAPGATILAPIELDPVDAIIPAGARLVLVLSNAGSGNGSDHRPIDAASPVTSVEVGGGASVLRLLAFDRSDGGRFFVPPGTH